MTELIEAVAPHLDEALREPVSYEMIGRILSAITDAGYRIVKDEVVAYLFEHEGVAADYGEVPLTERFKAEGWTEKALYAAPGDEK